MRETWVEVGSTRLFAWEDGTGFPIVMLHGFMSDHHAALPLVRPLIDRYRIITPDLRGSGKSWCGAALTFERLDRDLTMLLDELQVEQAVIAGVSSGAGVALRFALRHPERTRALAQVTPWYGGEAMGYTEAQRAAIVETNAIASRALEEGVQVLRPLYARLPDGMRERALALLDDWDAASVVATSHFLASERQPFVDGNDLALVGVPTLLLCGDDPMHPAAVSDLYRANIPDCCAERVPSSLPDVLRDFVDRCLGTAA